MWSDTSVANSLTYRRSFLTRRERFSAWYCILRAADLDLRRASPVRNRFGKCSSPNSSSQKKGTISVLSFCGVDVSCLGNISNGLSERTTYTHAYTLRENADNNIHFFVRRSRQPPNEKP